MNCSQSRAFWFFFEHSGYSYDPRIEGELAGRVRCALRSTHAEARGRAEGFTFRWEIDREINSSEFEDSGRPWALWCCSCHDYETDKSLASLCGIDFGRDGEPWGDDYRRVVESELASEALAALDKE